MKSGLSKALSEYSSEAEQLAVQTVRKHGRTAAKLEATMKVLARVQGKFSAAWAGLELIAALREQLNGRARDWHLGQQAIGRAEDAIASFSKATLDRPRAEMEVERFMEI